MSAAKLSKQQSATVEAALCKAGRAIEARQRDKQAERGAQAAELDRLVLEHQQAVEETAAIEQVINDTWRETVLHHEQNLVHSLMWGRQ